jgi:hypothetical protein
MSASIYEATMAVSSDKSVTFEVGEHSSSPCLSFFVGRESSLIDCTTRLLVVSGSTNLDNETNFRSGKADGDGNVISMSSGYTHTPWSVTEQEKPSRSWSTCDDFLQMPSDDTVWSWTIAWSTTIAIGGAEISVISGSSSTIGPPPL